MDNESTLDIGYLISTYTQSIREFFQQKIAELEAFSDYQAQQIEELTNKVIMLGILAIVMIVAFIVLMICLKAGKRRRRREELEEAEERLRREEQRLREERLFYESRRRDMQQGGNYYDVGYDYDDLGYRDENYGRREYRNEWTPKRESKEVRRRADRETQYIKRPEDFDDYDDYLT